MKKSLITLAVLSSLSFGALAQGYQAGDFVVRGGATLIDPDSGKADVSLYGNVPNVGEINGAVPLSVSVDDNTQLGLNFVYFFDSNWAVEVLAATPYTHDVTIHDSTGLTEVVFGANVDGATLAEVTHLPPTVSAIYYFDSSTAFKPYVGLGVNYTVFFDEEFKSAPKSLGFNDLEADGSFGLSPQIGFDYELTDKWHINASVRYIDIDTDVSFKIGDGIKGKAEVDVDPMVYSIMLGYKF
ncbi:outer membrane beta-barrel protein [Thalassotalea sp. M1531]|uniref:Outer membrane beta-barrel protein n=1 Tax=Thalassotalea algicola TaxID=2716224 RepID=A0A7Y0LAW6_9GAMM|nr:OmpW family outer membrane protein [Thalassotalea algicola]NMP30833.1 outer membrane beta-barrel protein [Thalassotalea algicola]